MNGDAAKRDLREQPILALHGLTDNAVAGKAGEKEEGCPVEVDAEEGSVLINYSGNAQSFKFDRAFGQETRQEDVSGTPWGCWPVTLAVCTQGCDL